MKNQLVIFDLLQNQHIKDNYEIEKPVEAEDIFEKTSGDPKDSYA